jgi:DNA-binding transcriptional MerR regulator
MDGLKIGELARRAGVTTKAIRFYERKRVLPPAKRAANRYRLYDEDAVGMLGFVKRASGLGLSLRRSRRSLPSAAAVARRAPTSIASYAISRRNWIAR